MAGSTIRPSTPIFAASLAYCAASAVVNSATPDRIGMRPLTTSLAALSTLRFSSARREQFSPTVPSMMKPCTPPWIRRSISFWVAGMFRLSSALNWVVTAGKTPFQRGRAMWGSPWG